MSELPRLRSLTLTLTERCSLRCSYCHVPVDRGHVMSERTLDQAIDQFARHASGSDVMLSFYGGEPFLALGAMRRAVGRAEAALGKRHLRVLTPTNGMHLDGDAAAFCREAGVELAVSIDGDPASTERCFPDGRPATPALFDRLPALLAQGDAQRRAAIARMTVTPTNVGELASSVRRLARLGFGRILYLPAFEAEWDDTAVATWAREHRRIGTWLVGARSAGLAVPDLPDFRAVEERLSRGTPRRACGAGNRLAAVSTDGGIFPCYRLVFHEDDGCRLGDVEHGYTNLEALARFAAFSPDAMRPEDGDCTTCASRDGCTHACPALGWEMLGDVAGVPAVACRLMRAKVEAIRPYAIPGRRVERRVATTLVAAAAMANAACGGSVATSGGGICASNADSGKHDAYVGGGICPVQADSGTHDAYAGGGICPVQVDSGTHDAYVGGGICATYVDSGTHDAYVGGGICPVQADSGTHDAYAGGGICPVQVDSGQSDAYIYGGGVCGWQGDSGQSDAYVYGGGICPVQVDSGTTDAYVYGGGICPVKPDSGGGIC